MNKLKVGVIGVGYLGQFHAEKYAAMPDVELVGVVDADPARAAEIANKNSTRTFGDPKALIPNVSAVSIVVPTAFHYRAAKECLDHGLHVLIEKPITETLEQADELIALAANKGVVLQVGHIERFNPAVTALKSRLKRPRYITTERMAPFTVRCTDVNVVFDLMIHDLDIVTDLAGARPSKISVAGASLITKGIDAATARIVFENGCVADVTASRVSEEKKRILRVYDGDSLYTSDYQAQRAAVSRKSDGVCLQLAATEIPTERRDTLKEEIQSFVRCVTSGACPLVSGNEGRAALALAQMITKNIEMGVTDFVSVS
jgi:predicted dehydrogenase